MNGLVPKSVKSSAVEMNTYIIQPNDLNYLGTVFGGTVMAEADKTAAIVAQLHSGRTCVTAAVDSFRFLAPAAIGEVLIFKAAVNRTWYTSMEVGVKVVAKNFKTGEERHVVSAYLTFVAINELRKPTTIPQVIPESVEEKRRFQQAELRKTRRLQDKKINRPA